MKIQLLVASLFAISLTSPVLGAGDIAAGEKTFKRCKACHMVADGDTMIYKGGKTGPNLFGIVGRQAGIQDGFRYGDSIVAAGEAGLVWDQEQLARYITDPKAFLKDVLDDESAKSKMSFKMKTGGEDVAAFLASVSPATE